MKRSTGTCDKKLAQKLADRFEEESRKKRTATKAREILSTIYRDLSGEDMPTKTVREFFQAYVARKKPEVAPATLAYYEGHARRFLEWLGPKADLDIAAITRKEITDYRNHAAAQSGPRATNNTVKAIRGFFLAASKDGLLSEDPAASVGVVRDRTESTRRPFTLDELRSLIAVADTEWKSMIRFGFFSGQRLSDIASLTWSNLDLERNEIRLVTKKTGRRQTIPIAPPLLEHIATLEVPNDPKAPIHPTSAQVVAGGKSATRLSRAFAGILEAAGLRSATGADESHARTRHELSFHSLRHSATSLLKNAGVPASVVMSYIGHDSPDVSHGYTHSDRESMEKAANAFPKL